MRKTWAAVVGAILAVAATQVLSAAPAAAATFPAGTVIAVTAQSPFDNLAVKQPFSAVCPDGRWVTGGGAFTVGGVHAVITQMRPIHPNNGVDPDRFEVIAAADQFGISGTWSFQVFAFCATAAVASSAGVEIVPHTNPATSAPTDQAFAPCPSGKFLVGAGGRIENGGGQVDLGMFPNSSGGLASASAAFAKEDADGFAGQYTLTGYSVCSRLNDVLNDMNMVRTQFTSPTTPQTIACPGGMALSGLAGATTVPGTHLQQIRPTRANSPANLATIGAQSSTPPGGTWQLDTTLFCVR